MGKTINVNIAVVGAGVAGLMLTKKLSDLGFSVCLIEKNCRIAGGPSTRNEGWLHSGTYHATSILDRDSAIQVAQRCIYGFDQIRKFAPEAIDDIHIPSYAIINNFERIDEVTSRWREAGVQHQLTDLRQFQKIEPNVNMERIASVYKVRDLSINTTILYRKLLSKIEKSGVSVLTNTKITYLSVNEVKLTAENNDETYLKADIFIYTAGYGIKEIFESNFSINVPLRCWKSHLLILPRINTHSVFNIEPGEVAMMHHGQSTIVGLNEDAILTHSLDYELISEKVENLKSGLNRMFKNIDLNKHYAISCIKVDLDRNISASRSLNVAYGEPVQNHFWLLPGKMTEAPFATDFIARLICERLESDRISRRPCDIWLNSNNTEKYGQTTIY